MTTLYYNLHFCTIYFSFALAGHRGTCLRPLHIFALLCFAFNASASADAKEQRQCPAPLYSDVLRPVAAARGLLPPEAKVHGAAPPTDNTRHQCTGYIKNKYKSTIYAIQTPKFQISALKCRPLQSPPGPAAFLPAATGYSAL